MPDATNNAADANNAGTTGSDSTDTSNDGGKSGYTPPATQDDFDRIISERLTRERAKFGDYADLKTKAEQFDKLEEANKTETQRQSDALAAAQKVAETATADALRFKVQAKFKLDDEDAKRVLTASNEEELTDQAKWFTERLTDSDSDRKKQGNHAPREGLTPTLNSGDEDRRTFVRNLTGRD